MKKILILLITLNLLLFADIAKVVAFKGDAFIIRGKQEIKLGLGTIILKDDSIKTQNNAKVQIIFKDNTIITIGKNAQLNINSYIFDEKNKKYDANFNLLKGAFRTITGKIGKIAPKRFKLNSKSSSIGIRGTQILSNVQISGDIIFCTEGEIDIVSKLTGETVTIKAGEFVEIKKDKPIIEIKKFDLKTISSPDEDTKFVPEEEKEISLENLGVEIPTTGVQEDIVETIDTTVTSDPTTFDTISNIKKVSGFVAISDSFFTFPTLGTVNQLTANEGTLDDGKIITNETISLVSNLTMNNFESNYLSDGSYSGTISQVDGTTFKVNNSTKTFNSGTYQSASDTTGGGYDINNDIQWGTWNITYNGSSSMSGYWLAGNETLVSEVPTTGTATYTGTVLGTESANGDAHNSTNSSVTLNIDFGGHTVNGTFSLDGANIGVSGSNVSSSGFSLTTSNPSAYSGNANGKFYGSNANNIAGNYKFTDVNAGDQYIGVYKASK